MATQTVVYIGAHAAVEVPAGELIAECDVPVKVDAELAKQLLKQPENWRRVESDAQRKAREQAEKDHAEQEAAAESARVKVAEAQAKRNKGGI